MRSWVACVVLLAACAQEEGLKPFTSDGCSLFPDASLINTDDWCDCCVAHDLAYWRGGTRAERETADQALKACVLEKTGDSALATLMYEGVRAGGSPYFYNWYRWSYGWPYERKYQALTPKETATADTLEQQFNAAGTTPCKPKKNAR